MKIRKKDYGNCNIVGKNIERLRKEQGYSQKDFISKIQLNGLDINPTSYSKLEGQIRIATDKEILTISKILNVDINELFNENFGTSEKSKIKARWDYLQSNTRLNTENNFSDDK